MWGAPDIIGWRHGKREPPLPVAIEVKGKGATLEKEQRKFLGELADWGWVVGLARHPAAAIWIAEEAPPGVVWGIREHPLPSMKH